MSSATNADQYDIGTKNTLKPEADEKPPDLRFPPKEELKLLAQSNEIKASANKLFADGSHADAITSYNRAIAECPTYLDYDLAVLHANIAACHLKLQDWKEAVESATKSLDGLEKLDPVAVPKAEGVQGGEANSGSQADGSSGNSIVDVDDDTETRLESLSRTGRTIDDVRRLRVKSLLRRAKAREQQSTWSSLQGAAEDYRQLSGMPLAALDAQAVRRALTELPPRLEEAKKREMDDMMGKLKQLGNGILKPFGLSTDNFSVVNNGTNGYSLSFDQGK